MKGKKLISQRGVAAVELGILLVPLTLLVFGISEYGRAFYEYNKIVKSARTAARYLTLVAPGDATQITNAKKLVVFGNTTGGTPQLLKELSISNVHVCDSKTNDGPCLAADQALQFTGNGTVNLVKVMVTNVQFTSLVPGIVSDLTFGPISLTMAQVQ